MKKIKIAVSVLLILILFNASLVFAASKQGVTYTRLGDSIAYGTGATNRYGYTDQFNDHLTRIFGKGVYHKEFAVNGITSSDMLASLSNPSVVSAIKSSDYITISIGGNDLLQPFTRAFQNLITTYYSTSSSIDFQRLMADLAAWQADPSNQKYAHFNLLLNGLQGVFGQAVLDFGQNTWPDIIAGIRAINPDAHIFVNTVYNPFVNIPILHKAIDPFIKGLNTAIKAYAGGYHYKVVDVYSKFEAYGNPKKLAVGDLRNWVQYTMDPTQVPVPLHPTDQGYRFILNLHKDLMD